VLEESGMATTNNRRPAPRRGSGSATATIALASRIAAGRQRKSWTIAQLATDAKVSPATIVAIESGRRGGRRIRFDVIVRLARSLQEPATDLLQVAGHSVDARMRRKVERE